MGAEQRRNPFAQWKQRDGVSKLNAYDRMGREIGPGDVVHILGKTDVMWKVTGVRPVLDKDAPPGLVEISLASAFLTGVQGGHPIPDLLKVFDAQEATAPKVAGGNGTVQEP